ncbi:hypothetical protein OPT61_g6489 [Boeremia exigua]|uniref:Uncharacterized protein n=1 Tax=Boeremia exigua TaxID=749465 RepID=A0ACC2I6F3_9PLEO|nr:hypothetical protein OPT61_g6489 [Boeremia exigua]
MPSILHSVPSLYDQPYDPVQQTEYRSPMMSHVRAKSEYSASRPHGKRGSIGWSTPLTILGSFLVAVAIATAHYTYCNYLHSKFVVKTIPQSWNNAISVIFAHAFATSLAAAVSTVFTQILWWYLRRRPLPISKIDALFSLNSNSLNLYRLDLLRATPALWFCGLLIPLISITTIFPPGSLVVQQLPNIQKNNSRVYTINVDNRGDGSAADFFNYATFDNDAYGGYLGPNRRFSLIAKRMIRGNRSDTISSPCGSNCTYDVKFPGPALSCKNATPNQYLEKMVFEYYLNKTQDANIMAKWDPSKAQYMAAPSVLDHKFNFEITYRDELTRRLRNISCTVFDAVYTAHVEYLGSVQNVTVEVNKTSPMNATALDGKSMFYDVGKAGPTATDFTKSKARVNNFTHAELNESFHNQNLRAMADTLMRALAGAISGYGAVKPSCLTESQSLTHLGTKNYFITNTIIEDTYFAKTIYDKYRYEYIDLVFRELSASNLERMMEEVVISILNNGIDKIDTEVTTRIYEAAYVFKDPNRMLIAYGGVIIVCFAFSVIGCMSLYQNGTSALSSGFLEFLCKTTYENGIMNQLAKEASLGGLGRAPKELTDLVVRYGIVTDGTTEKRHMAFGTVEETEPLLKCP